MIEKQYVKTRKVTKITFEHPVDVDVDVECWDDRDADAFLPNDQGMENGVVAG